MRIYIKTFGCRVNQVESEHLSEQLITRGCFLEPDFEKADICLLNTCTVTEKADKDVERELRQITKRNPGARLIATGCYASMHQNIVLKNAPHAEIVKNADKKNIISAITGKVPPHDGWGWEVNRHIGHNRAFVKIQDGCDAKCKYCIVWMARPVKSSKPEKEVLEEISRLVSAGFREIVLTGINIGSYNCPKKETDLAELLKKAAMLPGDFRLRFSSIEEGDITPQLLKSAGQAGNRFCSYFHIPLQSGSSKVLKEMGRRYSAEEYLEKTRAIRKSLQNPGIFADIIAGYPTETEKDFQESVDFVSKVGLSGLHVFSYSPRPGTEAALLPQLPKEIIKARADILRETDKKLRAYFAKSLIGTRQIILVEKTSPEATGLSSNFQKVVIKDNGLSAGCFAGVEIISAKNDICRGNCI